MIGFWYLIKFKMQSDHFLNSFFYRVRLPDLHDGWKVTYLPKIPVLITTEHLKYMFPYLQEADLTDCIEPVTSETLLSHLLPESAGIIRHGLIKFAETDDRGYRFNYYETAPAEYRNIAGELLEYVAEQEASADNVPDIPSIFSRDSGLDLSGVCLAAVRSLTEHPVVISRMVVTSDFRILLPDYDIEIGMAKTSGKYMVIPDRKEAILYAVRHAETGDMIAVIGKGHEDYQEIEGVRHHFLDREIVEEAVRETE